MSDGAHLRMRVNDFPLIKCVLFSQTYSCFLNRVYCVLKHTVVKLYILKLVGLINETVGPTLVGNLRKTLPKYQGHHEQRKSG